MERVANTGVYLITNKLDGKVYVGSAALAFNRRWNVHRHLLRAKRHDNRHLQAAWSRDGEPAFEFSILMRCSPPWCLAMEHHQIQRLRAFDDKIGYNFSVPGKGMLGRKHSEETRRKLCAARKGQVYTPERIAAMSAAQKRRVRSRREIENVGAAQRRPEARLLRSELAKKQWANPAMRARMTSANRSAGRE